MRVPRTESCLNVLEKLQGWRALWHPGAMLCIVALGSLALMTGCAGLVSGNPTPSSTVIISNLQSGAITTASSQVVWTTNVAADSSVDYGTTSAYGSSTQVNSAMVTSHQVTLNALAAGTTYYYQV